MKTRQKRIPQKDVYYEKHHIVMKSMGGSDDPVNIVSLTPREHFLAHWLLWRIHRNRQTALAFFTFKDFKSRNLQRYEGFSSIGYAEARESFSITQSEKMKGVKNSNRSKAVLQYSLSGEFIQEWPSAREAERQLRICHITSVCRGERKWAGEYFWKYKNPLLKKSKPYKKRITTISKPREQFDTSRISKAVAGRKWFNDGERDFFLKPHDNINGLFLGRLATRKQQKHQQDGKII